MQETYISISMSEERYDRRSRKYFITSVINASGREQVKILFFYGIIKVFII